MDNSAEGLLPELVSALAARTTDGTVKWHGCNSASARCKQVNGMKLRLAC